jgi:hypothetical protein
MFRGFAGQPGETPIRFSLERVIESWITQINQMVNRREAAALAPLDKEALAVKAAQKLLSAFIRGF